MNSRQLDVAELVASLALLCQNLVCWYALALVLKQKIANEAIINLLIAFSIATPLGTVFAWVVHLWPWHAKLYRPYLCINVGVWSLKCEWDCEQ